MRFRLERCLRTMLGKQSRGRDIERSRYREVDDYTQIYRRSDGFSHRTCFKNQYIFVFMMGAKSLSNSLLLSLLMVHYHREV